MVIGHWVSFGCFDWGRRLFHPDDRDVKDRLWAAGDVGEVSGEDGEFWAVRFGALRVRLRMELVGGVGVPPPPFVWGEGGCVKPPRTERAGHVCRIIGHSKQGRHLFWIEQNGRRVKSRYFAEELWRA